jgi:hypothetical protein
MRAIGSLLPRVERTLLYTHDMLVIPESRLDATMKVERLSTDTEDLLSRIGHVNPREIRQRMLRGDRCYLVRLGDGSPVHHAWVQTSGRHYLQPAGVHHATEHTQAWIYDCRTAEQARGKGIYTAILTRILADLKFAGFRGARIYTTRSNVASRHGIVRAGFTLETLYRSLRIGPWAVLLSRGQVQSLSGPGGNPAGGSTGTGM